MNRSVLARQMFAKGGAAFPDLNKDGEITQADILMGRGVEFKQEGGIAGMMPMDAPAAMPQEEGQALDPQVLSTVLGAASEQVGDLDNAEDYEEVMNSIRGDDATIEQRYAELAGVVGEEDARATPESVLTLVQPAMVMAASVDQGIGELAQQEMSAPVEGAMAQGIMSTVAPPEPQPMPMEGAPPVNFKDGGLVRRGDNQPVLKFQNAGVVPDPIKDAGRLGELYKQREGLYTSIVGDPTADLEEQKKLTQSQMLFDIANTALAFAAPMQGERPGMSAAERLAFAARTTQLPQTIGARAQAQRDKEAAAKEQQQKLKLSALSAAESGLAAEAKAKAELEKEQVRQAGAISQIELKDRLNLATQTALSELDYTQKLGLQKAAAGQQMDLQKFLQEGRLSLAEFNAVKQKELEIVSQKNREALAKLRGSIDFTTRTDLQAQAAEIAKQQAEIDSQLRIKELGIGVENNKVLLDYRAGIEAKQAELDRNFKAEQAELDRKQKDKGLDISREQLALDEKYKLGKLEIDRMVAEEVKVGSDSKTAQLKFLTDPERRRKYVTGELGDETALYEQALIEYAKPSFTWNGTSYVKNPTPQLAPALQQTLRERKANGFETPDIPGVKKAKPEPKDGTPTDVNSPEFKQSLVNDDGSLNFSSPSWEQIPNTVIDSSINYERATGIGELTQVISNYFTERLRETGLVGPMSEEGKELTRAQRDVNFLREEMLRTINNMSDDRVLKRDQDEMRDLTDDFTSGLLKSDESALGALRSMRGLLSRAFSSYAQTDPDYFPDAAGQFDEKTVTKDRRIALRIRSLLKDVITLEQNYEIFLSGGSKASRRGTRKRPSSTNKEETLNVIEQLATKKGN